MNSFTFEKFGKEDIKALKLSPDSFIQIAIQMAFIRYSLFNLKFQLYASRIFISFSFFFSFLDCTDFLPPTTNLRQPENFLVGELRPSAVVYQKLLILHTCTWSPNKILKPSTRLYRRPWKPTRIMFKWYTGFKFSEMNTNWFTNYFVTQAINGQGIDRHLLGLKKLAIENGIDIPTLYLDPGYSTSNNWRLSTSQVTIKCY